jgi:hypothetical protein
VARLAAVAGALVVLAVVLVWLTRSGDDGGFAGSPPGGVTVPTDDEGRPVDLPPSQPATAVLLDASGLLVRPDPVRARIVDPVSGQDVIVPLPPGSTVDTVTGEIVSHTTTTRAGGTPTSRLTTTTASETTTTEETTTTTEETTTTTEETTTTTEETTTSTSDTVVAG